MTLITRDTRLIFAETEEYPLFLDDFRARTSAVIGASIQAEALVDFGYFPVEEIEKPAVGEVITEGKPVQDPETGKWKRVWVVRDYNPEEEAAVLQQAKDTANYTFEQFRIAQVKIGFPFVHEGETYHVQVRASDLTNLTALSLTAERALKAEQNAMFSFRTYEDVNIELSTQEMYDLANLAFSKVSEGYAVIWALKDAARNATTVAEIPTVPEALFTL